MNVVELANYGFPDYFIKTWQQSGINQLFKNQEKVLTNNILFSQQNLIISSPTASGKTFLGELAAVKTVLNNRQVVYLAPLRSLAEEKYDEFYKRYNDYGLKVVISTGEKNSHDKDIGSGKFDLAIIVYEKLLSLLATRPTLLNLLGLVIIDELQNIGQSTRGIILEYLICLLMKYPQIKIIGLSAVIPNHDPLIHWLGANLSLSSERPHELREGVLSNGNFYYREFNSGLTGEEKLGTKDSDTWNLARELAESGQQSVIFLPDKQSTRSLAFKMAEESRLPRASTAIEDLQLLEPTTTIAQLMMTLERGIAFHNADLTAAERLIIEKYFKFGEIGLITATTTLAMGVNLPAKNVFIDPHIWRFDPLCQRPYLDILTKNEKENEAGRAGRFGTRSTFGRMIITATSPKEFDAYWNTYIEKDFQCTKTCFTPDQIAPFILWLISSTTRKMTDLESFFKSTYAHHLAQLNNQQPDWKEAIKKTLSEMAAHNLIFVSSSGTIIPSKLARIAATKRLLTTTVIQLSRWLETTPGRQVSDLEILYAASLTENGSNFYFSLESKPYLQEHYFNYIKEKMSEEMTNYVNETYGEQSPTTYYRLRAAKMVVVLNQRLSGIPILPLEKNSHCLAGEIIRLAEHIAWIVSCAALISKEIYNNPLFAKRLFLIKERLVYGVEEASLPLAKLRLPYLGNTTCQRLSQEGIDSLEAIYEISSDYLEKIVGEKIAKKITNNLTTHKPLKPKTLSGIWGPFYKDIIEITNLYRGRHYFINVNGQTVKLTRRQFEIILRLSLEMKKKGEGWVHKLDDAIADESLSIITRLRSNLKPYLHQNPKTVIESDQYGSLRISLPPQNLIFDRKKFSNHPHASIRQVIEKFQH